MEQSREIKSLILPSFGTCYNFTDEKSKTERKSIVISPISIKYYPDASGYGVSWACSRGSTCFDKECRYASKDKKNNRTD